MAISKNATLSFIAVGVLVVLFAVKSKNQLLEPLRLITLTLDVAFGILWIMDFP
jgi:hypothetical protein